MRATPPAEGEFAARVPDSYSPSFRPEGEARPLLTLLASSDLNCHASFDRVGIDVLRLTPLTLVQCPRAMADALVVSCARHSS